MHSSARPAEHPDRQNGKLRHLVLSIGIWNSAHSRYLISFHFIASCQPVTTASAERSFSALKRIQTWLRSTIRQPRLSGMAMMNIHSDQVPSPHAILDRFMMLKIVAFIKRTRLMNMRCLLICSVVLQNSVINSFNVPVKGICL